MADENLVTHGRTSSYRLNYYLVWNTKCSDRVLKGPIKDELTKLFTAISLKYGFRICKLVISDDDYVHMVVTAQPSLSVTAIVKHLKGESGIKLLKQLRAAHSVSEDTCHLWSNRYFAESIGNQTINHIESSM